MATTKEARNKNIPGFNTIPLEVKNDAHYEDPKFHEIPWYGISKGSIADKIKGFLTNNPAPKSLAPEIWRPARQSVRELTPRERNNPAAAFIFSLHRDIAMALMIEPYVIGKYLSVSELNDWHNKMRRPYARLQKHKPLSFAKCNLVDVVTFMGCSPIIEGRPRLLPYPLYRAVEYIRAQRIDRLDLLEAMRGDCWKARCLLSVYNEPPNFGKDFDITTVSPKDALGMIWLWLKAIPEEMIPAQIARAILSLCIVRRHATLRCSDFFRAARLMLCMLTEPAFNILCYLTDFFHEICLDPQSRFDINCAAEWFGVHFFGLEQMDCDEAIPVYKWILYNWVDLRIVWVEINNPVKIPIPGGHLNPMKNNWPLAFPRSQPPTAFEDTSTPRHISAAYVPLEKDEWGRAETPLASAKMPKSWDIANLYGKSEDDKEQDKAERQLIRARIQSARKPDPPAQPKPVALPSEPSNVSEESLDEETAKRYTGKMVRRPKTQKQVEEALSKLDPIAWDLEMPRERDAQAGLSIPGPKQMKGRKVKGRESTSSFLS